MAHHCKVGAIHALQDSIGPTGAAFAEVWPEADVAHLMDGSLYLDRSRGTADAAELGRRIKNLIIHSESTGAEGILFTGSFFGAQVEAARSAVSVPVLASFDGLIESALALGGPLRVLSTAPDSVTLLTEALQAAASAAGQTVSVVGSAIPGAMEALVAGDLAQHDEKVYEAVRDAEREVTTGGAIVIAQFSMERVLARLKGEVSAPILGPGREAARKLRQLIGGET